MLLSLFSIRKIAFDIYSGGSFCIIFTWIFSDEPPPSGEDKEDRIPLGWSPHHIDVVVLLILVAIMIINFIIMRQEVVLKVIRYTQNVIRYVLS